MGGRSTLSISSCVIFCIIVGLLLFLQSTIFVEGHGYIKSPRARNFVAYEDTIWHPQTANDPEPETCPHCLNRGGSRARCGIAEDTSGIIKKNDMICIGDKLGALKQLNCSGQIISCEPFKFILHKGTPFFSGELLK